MSEENIYHTVSDQSVCKMDALFVDNWYIYATLEYRYISIILKNPNDWFVG